MLIGFHHFEVAAKQWQKFRWRNVAPAAPLNRLNENRADFLAAISSAIEAE